jgi:2-haloacid dehalogenase
MLGISMKTRFDAAFPGKGDQVRALWRTKYHEYNMIRALTGRYIDFWEIARDALRYAAKYYRVHLEEDELTGILEGYFRLAPFSDVQEELHVSRNYTIKELTNLRLLLDGIG